MTETSYPPLPEPDATTVGLGAVWNRHSMRAYVDAALEAQAREIEALQADAARIDFLQRGGDVSISIVIDAPGDGGFVVGHDLGSSGQGMSLREAIDNAIFEAGG